MDPRSPDTTQRDIFLWSYIQCYCFCCVSWQFTGQKARSYSSINNGDGCTRTYWHWTSF